MDPTSGQTVAQRPNEGNSTVEIEDTAKDVRVSSTEADECKGLRRIPDRLPFVALLIIIVEVFTIDRPDTHILGADIHSILAW